MMMMMMMMMMTGMSIAVASVNAKGKGKVNAKVNACAHGGVASQQHLCTIKNTNKNGEATTMQNAHRHRSYYSNTSAPSTSFFSSASPLSIHTPLSPSLVLGADEFAEQPKDHGQNEQDRPKKQRHAIARPQNGTGRWSLALVPARWPDFLV